MAVKLTSEDEVRERLVPVVLGADILGYTYVRSFHAAARHDLDRAGYG